MHSPAWRRVVLLRCGLPVALIVLVLSGLPGRSQAAQLNDVAPESQVGPGGTQSGTPPADGSITATNCPQPPVCSSVTCPTSTNWINPMNAPYNAAGNGITDDSAALQSASDAGDVCLPSGHTFLVNNTGVNITVSNKHWQAGMIGGAAPIISNTNHAARSAVVIQGPTGAGQSITGDSVIGIDFEGPNTTTPPTYNEWNMGLTALHNANNGLFAGNTFNNWEGDGELEINGPNGAAAASPCAVGNLVAYNTFKNCGLYGGVLVGGRSNNFNHNTYTDCDGGQENDNASQCVGGNVWDHETVTMITGSGWNGNGTCKAFITGGTAGGANYSGNTVSNSAVTGSCADSAICGTNTSCLWEKNPNGSAVYINDTCTNGCQIR
jgi:hypothetical protein